jgi:deoxyadenosine/deoxycytidine kinase
MLYQYVAIEGLIGAGKTTLAKRLAEPLNARLVLEEFDDNPFLPRFYADPVRYAFSVELSFLAQRYHQLKRVSERDLFRPNTVADYSIGKSLIFAQATLPKDELRLFRDLYDIMYADLVGPELIVYLHLPRERVREQIAKRGRTYEKGISEEYLDNLHELYLDHLHKLDNKRVVILDLQNVDLLTDGNAFRAVQVLFDVSHPLGVTVLNAHSL